MRRAASSFRFRDFSGPARTSSGRKSGGFRETCGRLRVRTGGRPVIERIGYGCSGRGHFGPCGPAPSPARVSTPNPDDTPRQLRRLREIAGLPAEAETGTTGFETAARSPAEPIAEKFGSCAPCRYRRAGRLPCRRHDRSVLSNETFIERNESPTDSAVPGRPTTYRQPFDNRSTTAPGEKNNLFTDYRRVFNRYPQNYRQPSDKKTEMSNRTGPNKHRPYRSEMKIRKRRQTARDILSLFIVCRRFILDFSRFDLTD